MDFYFSYSAATVGSTGFTAAIGSGKSTNVLVIEYCNTLPTAYSGAGSEPGSLYH